MTIYIDTNIIMSESFFRSPWVKSFLKACDHRNREPRLPPRALADRCCHQTQDWSGAVHESRPLGVLCESMIA